MPELSELDRKLLALDPERRAQVARRLEEEGLGQSVFPVTSGQAAILFLEQLHPNNPGYHIPAVIELSGPLDIQSLQAAADRVVRRHETLRTSFEVREGRPVQVVHRFLTVTLAVEELTGAAQSEVDETVEAELSRPLDLARGPLVRMKLLRRSADSHLLLVTMHHLITDGWSMSLFVSELTEVYGAHLEHRQPQLARLAIQYGDYTAWEQVQQSTPRRAEGLAYWLEHLRGAPAALTLPTEKARPVVQGFRGGSAPFALSAEALQRLTDLGRSHGATPYMVLLTLFHLLLYRAGGQDDVVVGVPTAGRNRTEVQPLIGFFVNTVPIRARFDPALTLGQCLEQVRDACRSGYAHDDVPIDQIVEKIRPARDLSRSPVFQACFSYQADPFGTMTMGDVRMRLVPRPSAGARFDLEIQSFCADGAVHGWFEYDRDVFDEASVERLARQFEQLAACAPGSAQIPVRRLPLMADDERRQVLDLCTGPVRQWGDGWVPDIITRRAAQLPDRTAMRFVDASLTYAELDRMVNQLAHHLSGAGVRPGALVGVALERSVELVVALLAVLRAGGAFVLIDVDLPKQRVDVMLSGAVAVLTSRSLLAGDLVWSSDRPAWSVEDLIEESSGELLTPPPVTLRAEDPAYVIYTSGSTGTPKGVVNTHGGLRNRLLWMQDAFGIGPGDRVLQKTPTSFDVSVWEFLWPFMTGATLVVLPPRAHKDPAALVDAVRREGITTIHFVPSMLRLFVQHPGIRDCTSLRRVICSGEVLPRDLADEFLTLNGAELHNLYGPAEAAIDVTSWQCRADDPPGPVPIGRPIANTQVYVLDQEREPVPLGVAGELFLGGDNIAHGYAGRPDLTSERFLDDHLGTSATGRLYRTGDLGRIRADGAIDYLGRTDHQIKLRGQRIELGEIESVLMEHPAVREAVVVAHERSAGDVRLVGYLRADGEPVTADLAAFCRRRLPEYMAPGIWVVLDRFPLSPNGKCDRAALPPPEGSRAASAEPYVAASDDVTQAITDVWREVLGLERVGVNDAFFDLGGHSLLLAQVRDRLSIELGQELTMLELLQYPTVAALATHLRQAPEQSASAQGRDRAADRRRARSGRQASARAISHPERKKVVT